MFLKWVVIWSFILLAVSLLGTEVLVGLENGAYHFLSLLDVWRHYAGDSLKQIQALEDHRFLFWIWDPVLRTALAIPAWLLPGALGIWLLWTTKRPERKTIRY